jgi:hypothetical protein
MKNRTECWAWTRFSGMVLSCVHYETSIVPLDRQRANTQATRYSALSPETTSKYHPLIQVGALHKDMDRECSPFRFIQLNERHNE